MAKNEDGSGGRGRKKEAHANCNLNFLSPSLLSGLTFFVLRFSSTPSKNAEGFYRYFLCVALFPRFRQIFAFSVIPCCRRFLKFTPSLFIDFSLPPPFLLSFLLTAVICPCLAFVTAFQTLISARVIFNDIFQSEPRTVNYGYFQ